MPDDTEIDPYEVALKMRVSPDVAAIVMSNLAIAKEVRLLRESQSMCPHGTIGFCMDCLFHTLEGVMPRGR